MKRQHPESVGDILRQVVEESNMTARLDECRAVELWPLIVGERLTSCTGRPSVRNGLMTVSVPAAPLRNELHLCRSGLVQAINDAVGRPAIRDIRFIG